MEFTDIKNKSAEELKEMLSSARDQLRSLNFKAKSGQLKQVHKLAETRKNIARISMLLSVKK